MIERVRASDRVIPIALPPPSQAVLRFAELLRQRRLAQNPPLSGDRRQPAEAPYQNRIALGIIELRPR